jgi:hypothetical protein
MIWLTLLENFDCSFATNDLNLSPIRIRKSVVSVTNEGKLVTIDPEVVSRITSRAGNLQPTKKSFVGDVGFSDIGAGRSDEFRVPRPRSAGNDRKFSLSNEFHTGRTKDEITLSEVEQIRL